jgi:two-component system nitrate/nitrite response regulator NarP
MTVQVLIVDDHPMIRSAVAALLEGSEFAIVASAASAQSAIERLSDSDPDMVILDIAMPGGSGLDVLRQMRAQGDRRPVIILTAGIDDYPLTEAIKLGVDGIVMKNNDPAYLLDCLQAVQGGGHWFDPDVKERADQLARRGPDTVLSKRERELVTLVARGLRNREIAAELGITEGTVKVYLHAIFDKLGVANRTELAMRAAEEGLGS